mmetsp:Transcript_31502/g.64078  ORF Transcript_31502/g.64078 Transcript_31502/m.64078 type:complete len:539 (+) Transcript_31502:227-1843(+)
MRSSNRANSFTKLTDGEKHSASIMKVRDGVGDGSFPSSPSRTVESKCSARTEQVCDIECNEDKTSSSSHDKSSRRCNPTKRWALVAWLVAAALAIAIVIALVAVLLAEKPQNNSATNNNSPTSDSETETLDDHTVYYGSVDGNVDLPPEEDVADIFAEPEDLLDENNAPAVTTPTRAVTSMPNSSDYTIGVYYYPWHGSNFHGRQYLRGYLDPPQLPALGEYDDTEPAVIRQHLEWSRGANINLWVASWWGPGSREDTTLKNVILPHSDLPGTKIALFYETTSRIKKSMNYTTVNVYADVEYIAKTYFDDPNYLRIGNRPVLFVYLSRVLSRVGVLEEVTTLMRDAAFEHGGHDLYIMGDQVFGSAPDDGRSYDPFDLLDGVTNYDIYGNMKRPNGYAGAERVNELHKRNTQWRDETRAHGNCDFVPGVAPGYNDRAVRDGNPPLSRRLTESSAEGSLFKAGLESALSLVEDSTDRMLMITSWNEWHEDTQIEPVVDVGVTDRPLSLTCYRDPCDVDLKYHAYGELYLDILRDATSDT